MTRSRALFALSAIATACAFGSEPYAAERQELGTNQRAWRETGITHYEFDYRRGCFCPPETTVPVTILVEGDEIVSVVFREDGPDWSAGDPMPELYRSAFPSIDEIFEEIRLAIAREYPVLEAAYDPSLHYPTEVSIVQCSQCTDAGILHTVTDVRPRPTPLSRGTR